MYTFTTIHLNIYIYINKKRIIYLDLKALIEGAIFVSKSRLFQRLAPRHAKDFRMVTTSNSAKTKQKLKVY